MSLFGDRTIRHRSGLKSGHNRIHTFYLIKRYTLLRVVEFHLSTQIDFLSFFIHHLRVLLEHIIIAASCSLLQHMNGLWIVEMFFSTALCFMFSLTVQGHIHL